MDKFSADKLDILVWHGYLLNGTGSNIYAQNISRQLYQKGNRVHLFCQDPYPMTYDHISKHFKITEEAVIELERKNGPDKCQVYNPEIGSVLPVYVLDSYKKFTAKLFLDLTEEELEIYINKNVEAVEALLSRQNIDVMHVNHAVMGPYIAAKIKKKFGIPFVVTIHGSDLEFTIKHSKKYQNFAHAGLLDADRIVVPSRHIKRITLEIIPDNKLEKKIEIVPAGVDSDQFIPFADKKRALEVTVNSIKKISCEGNGFNDRLPDKGITEKLLSIDPEKDSIIIFTGKLIATKGIHLLAFAIPFIVDKIPDVKFIISGFGPLRKPLETLLISLKEGKGERLQQIVEAMEIISKPLGKMPSGPLSCLEQLKNTDLKEKIFDVSSNIDFNKKVIFTGPLAHSELAPLLSVADVSLIISVFPEAFGLVAVEAAACGVLPVVANHSGLAEIGEVIEDFTGAHKNLLRVDLNKNDSILQLVDHTVEALNFLKRNPEIKTKLRAVAVEKFDWSNITDELLKIYKNAIK